ncbi:oligopeptide/dipeptide ABC transporter ATP-binding protein [Streptomyces sp. NPDC059637]|uniref:oligopeptide/dipeptide ABC transporter ATP-binding protein n=1 Tax=Streptomyces sp. NPDC059637 TaxID=3347752 RepID=UPI0036D00200
MRRGADVAAVTGASFDLAAGQCLALVGESGCGKSVLASALLGLLPANARATGTATVRTTGRGGGAETDGDPATARPAGSAAARLRPGLRSHIRPSPRHAPGAPDLLDLLAADEETLARRVRGRLVGLVPQSPAAHLTPVRTVRSQLEETVRELCAPDRQDLRAAAEAAAGRAAFPADHLDHYPHQLSGGLAQRAALALALVGDAPVLLADEPTTGLDRDLVNRTADELRRHADSGRAVLLVTHDLAAAERTADRVAVMYAGRIVELSDARDFFGTPGPRHPYAAGLLDALPTRGFRTIPGAPPELGSLPAGCAFAPRCHRATATCTTTLPAPPAPTGGAACHHPLEPAPAATTSPTPPLPAPASVRPSSARPAAHTGPPVPAHPDSTETAADA